MRINKKNIEELVNFSESQPIKKVEKSNERNFLGKDDYIDNYFNINYNENLNNKIENDSENIGDKIFSKTFETCPYNINFSKKKSKGLEKNKTINKISKKKENKLSNRKDNRVDMTQLVDRQFSTNKLHKLPSIDFEIENNLRDIDSELKKDIKNGKYKKKFEEKNTAINNSSKNINNTQSDIFIKPSNIKKDNDKYIKKNENIKKQKEFNINNIYKKPF